MAKSSEKEAAVVSAAVVPGAEVTELEGASLPAVSIEHPSNKEEKGNGRRKSDSSDDYAEFNAGQDAALLEYRVSGINRGYVDPTRDQEPDIAPEFGVSPHPELFNPKPPQGPHTGVESKSDVVASVEEKTERGEEAREALEAQAEAENEAAGDESEELTAEDILNRKQAGDESAKASDNVGPHV